MKIHAGLFVLCLASSNLWAAEKVELKTQEQRQSYNFGFQQGNIFKQNNVGIDADVFARGLRDALGGQASAMSLDEIQETVRIFSEQREKKGDPLGVNLKQGEAFLAENRKKSDVKVLPSGLQYTILKPGEGKSPTINDTVVAHYRGTLIDGKEFDSSYKRNEPATFPLRNVIKGWQEALPLLHEGGKMKIVVPSNLAYGPRSKDDLIGPNSTLIFEIELVSVKSAAKP